MGTPQENFEARKPDLTSSEEKKELLNKPLTKQYLASERAHLMCPNMHFGMLFRINGEYDETKLREVLANASLAHPFLRSVIASEEGTDKLYYNVTSTSKITLKICDKAFDIAEYEALMKCTWNVFEEGLLRVFVYKTSSDFEVLFMAHHLLCDGSGLLMLVQEIANNYVAGEEISFAEEKLISSIDELPQGSALGGISKLLVKRANKQWKKENHKVSYGDYLSFEKDYNSKHKLEYQTYDVSDEAYEEMRSLCKENEFTMNDLLMAKMYIKTGWKKIIIAADIRDKLANKRSGTLGNFATAMGIECKSKTTDEVAKAKEVHEIVRKTLGDNKKLMLVLACYFEMDPNLLDAAAIAGLGGFESKAASFVGGGMFGFAKPASYSITNLGRISCPSLKSAMFIPPASPAAKLTLGVVTVNDKMYACSSKCI